MISPKTFSGVPAFQFKAARQPMLWAASAHSLGIIVGVYAWRPASWWIAAAALFIGAAAYFAGRRSGMAWLLGLGTLFLAGALHVQLRSASPRLDTGILPFADRQEVQITAHVKSVSRVQRAAGELRQTLDLECEQILTADLQLELVHSGI